MFLRKSVEDPADRARLGQHAPDFCTHAIEIEVRARTKAHDDGAVVELGGRQCLVLHENAIERQVQNRNSEIAWVIQSLSSTNNANCGSMAQRRQAFLDDAPAISLFLGASREWERHLERKTEFRCRLGRRLRLGKCRVVCYGTRGLCFSDRRLGNRGRLPGIVPLDFALGNPGPRHRRAPKLASFPRSMGSAPSWQGSGRVTAASAALTLTRRQRKTIDLPKDQAVAAAWHRIECMIRFLRHEGFEPKNKHLRPGADRARELERDPAWHRIRRRRAQKQAMPLPARRKRARKWRRNWLIGSLCGQASRG